MGMFANMIDVDIELATQWRILLVLILAFLCYLYNSLRKYRNEIDSEYSNEEELDQEEQDNQDGQRPYSYWKFLLGRLHTFPLFLMLLAIMISLFLLANIIIAYAEKNGITVTSVLQYDDLLLLIPSFLSLVITIIIAFLQIRIQHVLQKSNEVKERLQQKHNETKEQIQRKHNEEMRNNDLKARKYESISKSIKADLCFSNSFWLGFRNANMLEIKIFLNNSNDVIQYYEVKHSEVTINQCKFKDKTIERFESSNDIIFLGLDISALQNDDIKKIEEIKKKIEDALLGISQPLSLELTMRVKDNSLPLDYSYSSGQGDETAEKNDDTIIQVSSRGNISNQIRDRKFIEICSNWKVSVLQQSAL